MLLSIIIPAYNEEKNLKRSVGNFYNYLKSQNYDYEMIIVNDGSTDSTADIARDLLSSYNNLTIIENRVNSGKGFAVKRGMLEAKGDFRLFIDADGATSIDHVEKIWPLFKEGFDIVIGSRNKKDARESRLGKAQPYWKIFLGKCGNKIIQLSAAPGIHDTQCGFKAFTKKTAEKIFPKLKINRWMFDVEILVWAKKLNYKIAKIPVFWTDYGQSRVGVKGYLTSLREIVKIKISLLSGKDK